MVNKKTETKTNPLKLAGLALLMAFLLIPSFSRAIEGGSTNLDQNLEEGLERSLKTATPSNLFNTSNSELASSYAVYSSVLSDIKITPNPDNKAGYSAGDTLNYKGKLSYSSGSVRQNLEGERGECLKKFAGKSEQERNDLCAIGEIFTVPSFANVGILAKVWRTDESAERIKTGDYLVDEFYVVKGVDLKDGEVKDLDFNWKIPGESKAGRYYAAFFVNSEEQFNLLGFPASVWSPMARFDFGVTERNVGNSIGSGVEIDKNNLKINETTYSPIDIPPTIEPKDGKIEVKFPITNLDVGSRTINIKYELRNWINDSARELLDTKEETKTISSGEKAELSYSFAPNTRDSFYNLKAMAKTANSVSTVDFFLIVKDSAKGIFSFLGMAGNQEGIFHPMFCALNAQWEGTFPGMVKILATDEKGKEIASWQGKGLIEPVNSSCFVVKGRTFKPENARSCIKIKGDILDANDKLADSIETSYNCAKSGDEGAKPNESFLAGSAQNLGKNKILIMLAVVILIGLSSVLIYFNRKKDETYF